MFVKPINLENNFWTSKQELNPSNSEDLWDALTITVIYKDEGWDNLRIGFKCKSV